MTTLSSWNELGSVRGRTIVYKNRRFSSHFAAVSFREDLGTSATQRQKFHTDDVNQSVYTRKNELRGRIPSSHKKVFSIYFWFSVILRGYFKDTTLMVSKSGVM